MRVEADVIACDVIGIVIGAKRCRLPIETAIELSAELRRAIDEALVARVKRAEQLLERSK